MQFESNLQYIKWQQRLGHSRLFRYWWQFWSNYSFAVFFVTLIYAMSIGMNTWLQMILSAIVSFLIARGFIVALVNMYVQRVRPYQKYKFHPITSRFFSNSTKINNSFPSRHVAALSSIAGAVMLFDPVSGAVLFLTTLLTGIARVLLGYHYPTDIAVGLLLGTIVGLAVSYVALFARFT